MFSLTVIGRIAYHMDKAIVKMGGNMLFYLPLTTCYRAFMELSTHSTYPTDDYCARYRASIAIYYIWKLEFLQYLTEVLRLPRKNLKCK